MPPHPVQRGGFALPLFQIAVGGGVDLQLFQAVDVQLRQNLKRERRLLARGGSETADLIAVAQPARDQCLHGGDAVRAPFLEAIDEERPDRRLRDLESALSV